MPARVVATVLALMLLWSSLATHGSWGPLASMGVGQAHVLAPASVDGPDDPLLQALAEPAADLEALVVQQLPRGPSVAATGPWPWSKDPPPAPFLDGLQRPPRALRVPA
jgi:hypothetical protein